MPEIERRRIVCEQDEEYEFRNQNISLLENVLDDQFARQI
jgi:hypothetical protein